MCHEHTLIEGLRAITRYVQALQIWDIAVKVWTTYKGVLVFAYQLRFQCAYVAVKYISTNMQRRASGRIADIPGYCTETLNWEYTNVRLYIFTNVSQREWERRNVIKTMTMGNGNGNNVLICYLVGMESKKSQAAETNRKNVIYTPLNLVRCYVNRLLVTMVNLCKEYKLPNYRHLLSSSSSLPAWRSWQAELTRSFWHLRIVRSRRAPEKLQSTWLFYCSEIGLSR